jgi:hypothetical protein
MDIFKHRYPFGFTVADSDPVESGFSFRRSIVIQVFAVVRPIWVAYFIPIMQLQSASPDARCALVGATPPNGHAELVN